MHITGIILAAGTSSRMGSINKLLLPYGRHTVIEEVLLQMSESVVDGIVVVTGHEHELIEKILVDRPNDRIGLIHNHDYQRGRAESIKYVISHLRENIDAALFMVADKPGITSGLINRAIERFKQEMPAILYVQTPSGRGHPIIFSKTVFDDLLKLEGDIVGDDLVEKHAHDTSILEDEKPQIDINTEEDYRILLKNEFGQ